MIGPRVDSKLLGRRRGAYYPGINTHAAAPAPVSMLGIVPDQRLPSQICPPEWCLDYDGTRPAGITRYDCLLSSTTGGLMTVHYTL